jgi:hypothetical protein
MRRNKVITLALIGIVLIPSLLHAQDREWIQSDSRITEEQWEVDRQVGYDANFDVAPTTQHDQPPETSFLRVMMGVSYWPSLSSIPFDVGESDQEAGRFYSIGLDAEFSMHGQIRVSPKSQFHLGGDIGLIIHLQNDGEGYPIQYSEVELSGYVSEFILYFTPSVRWTFHRNSKRQFYIKVGGGYYRSALKANAFLVEKNWVSHSPGGHASLGIRIPTRHRFAWELDIQVHFIGFRRPELFASQEGHFKFPIAFRVGVSIF